MAQMCRLLLANGASVSMFDNKKRRVLHLAAYHGHLEILKMLIENGADLNSRDYEVRASPHSSLSLFLLLLVRY